MKKITIELDDNYGTILSITAVGHTKRGVNVSTSAIDAEKHNKIVIGCDGKAAVCNE